MYCDDCVSIISIFSQEKQMELCSWISPAILHRIVLTFVICVFYFFEGLIISSLPCTIYEWYGLILVMSSVAFFIFCIFHELRERYDIPQDPENEKYTTITWLITMVAVICIFGDYDTVMYKLKRILLTPLGIKL